MISGTGTLIFDEGPNHLLYFAPVALPVPAFTVSVSPGLSPGDPWYVFHQGQAIPNTNGAQRYCSSSQLDQIRTNALAHEGFTPNPLGPSHYDVYVTGMQARDFNQDVDSLVIPFDIANIRNPNNPNQVFLDSLTALYNDFVSNLDTDPAQAAVDAPGSATRLQVPCRLLGIP